MSCEVLGNVAFEQDNLGFGIILKSLDYISKPGESVLTPNIHFRLSVVESDFKYACTGLVGSEPRIDWKVEGENGRKKQRHRRNAQPRERHNEWSSVWKRKRDCGRGTKD